MTTEEKVQQLEKALADLNKKISKPDVLELQKKLAKRIEDLKSGS